MPTTALAVLVLVTSVPGAFGAELGGRVVGVRDGDTLDLLTPGDVSVHVRLAGIDAPEMGQAFGKAAKQARASPAYRRDARARRLGLWRDGKAVPPWVFRHPDRRPAAPGSTAVDPAAAGGQPIEPGDAIEESLPHIKFRAASGG